MSSIVLSVHPKWGLASALRRLARPGRVLNAALSDRYSVSLAHDGVVQEILISGKSGTELATNWSFPGSKADFLKFLKRYRLDPTNCRPEAPVRAVLRDFLFCGGKLDGPLASLMTPRSVININADQPRPLLLNVPWELADGTPAVGNRSSLSGTLAAFPIVRIASECASNLDITQERLRVAYCIVESANDVAITGAGFDDALHGSLARRSGVVDAQRIGPAGGTPTFASLSGELTAMMPHIFVIVSHGQTVDGRPELMLDKWTSVSEIARVLASYRKTLLVMMVACDLTFLESGATAHSGAFSMLEVGIPAVVAMQSKVRADLAAIFLGTTLDFLLAGPSLPLAVAEGRKSMAPTPRAAESIVDWSFPALFLTGDGLEKTRALQDYFQFKPSLEALLRSIPRSEPFLERPSLRANISDLLGASGFRAISGEEGMGKTHLVRAVSRDWIESMIRSGSHALRPIVYLDLDRFTTIDSAADLIARIRDRVDEVKPTVTGPPLVELKLPILRGPDGAGKINNVVQRFVELLDGQHCILVLDFPGNVSDSVWHGFLEPCRSLLHSLVVGIVQEVPKEVELPDEYNLAIGPFTKNETKLYMDRLWPRSQRSGDDVYRDTAGVPRRLNGLRLGQENDLGSITEMISTLSAPDQGLLFRLVHLSNGVDASLGWDFVPGWSDVQLPSLVRRGLLLQETRFGVDWISIPGMLARSIRRAFETEVQTGAEELAQNFKLKITEGSVEEEVIKLADRPGGLPFVNDIQSVLITVHSSDTLAQARALPLLLHAYLFQKARWRDAYRLEKRALEVTSGESTEAADWIRLSKSQRMLGLFEDARTSLKQAEAFELSAIDNADLILAEQMILKDLGHSDPVGGLEKYQEALSLLEMAEEDQGYLAELKANVLYNRGIHRAWLVDDLRGALQDFETAEAEYSLAQNYDMVAMCKVEWAEVQFDARLPIDDWPLLFTKLVDAQSLLEKADALGDLAFCEYQMARYYRAKPADTAAQRFANLANARSAYRKTILTSEKADDRRLALISQVQIVELSFRDLRDMSGADALPVIQFIVRGLETFRNDLWAARVRRDALLLLSEVAVEASPGDMVPTLADAWQTAAGSPLNPSTGTDARRAAYILDRYLRALRASGNGVDVDIVANRAASFVEQWLGHAIDPQNLDNWLPELENFGRRAGEQDG